MTWFRKVSMQESLVTDQIEKGEYADATSRGTKYEKGESWYQSVQVDLIEKDEYQYRNGSNGGTNWERQVCECLQLAKLLCLCYQS